MRLLPTLLSASLRALAAWGGCALVKEEKETSASAGGGDIRQGEAIHFTFSFVGGECAQGKCLLCSNTALPKDITTQSSSLDGAVSRDGWGLQETGALGSMWKLEAAELAGMCAL